MAGREVDHVLRRHRDVAAVAHPRHLHALERGALVRRDADAVVARDGEAARRRVRDALRRERAALGGQEVDAVTRVLVGRHAHRDDRRAGAGARREAHRHQHRARRVHRRLRPRRAAVDGLGDHRRRRAVGEGGVARLVVGEREADRDGGELLLDDGPRRGVRLRRRVREGGERGEHLGVSVGGRWAGQQCVVVNVKKYVQPMQ